jgi:hypothetical protein
MEILKTTGSVNHLMNYFQENGYFDKAIERDACKFSYRIGLKKWENVTGILENDMPTRYSSNDLTAKGDLFPYLTEGRIWVDFYMDADYTDYDSPSRYVYLG